jgi:tripartite ATP-independent transporter DctP family solute receptor
VGATVSASPEERDAEWTARLPEIPDATGVFWPSVAAGVVFILWGLYLILTPPTLTVAVAASGSPTGNRASSSATPNGAITDTTTFRAGLVDSKDSTFAQAMEEFAKEVERRSQGEMRIELFSGGLVDGAKMDERQLVEAVRSGSLAIGLSTTSPLTNYNHLLDVFDLPFLFRSAEHADQVLDGPVGQRLLDCLRDKNLVGLGYMEVGFRVFSSSIPLPDYASFSGKKLRVMQSVTFTRFVKEIGADPVPAPVDKIYLMGKEGYIDGADRTYPTYWDFQLYDVHRFISQTEHAYSVKMILVNDKVFESLTPAQRDLLLECAKEASRHQRKKQREADKAVKEMALKEGIKIFEISPEERAKFVEASTELYEEYRRNQSAEILDTILQQGKEQRT